MIRRLTLGQLHRVTRIFAAWRGVRKTRIYGQSTKFGNPHLSPSPKASPWKEYRSPESNTVVGRWARDEAYLVGEYGSSELFEESFGYRNISRQLTETWNDFIGIEGMRLEPDRIAPNTHYERDSEGNQRGSRGLGYRRIFKC